MDAADLFDTPGAQRPQIRLKSWGGLKPQVLPEKPAQAAPSAPEEPTSAKIAGAMEPWPGDCPYGGPEEEILEEEDPEPAALDGDLDVDIATRASQAAAARDEFSAAKAAYDHKRSKLQQEMDLKLSDLKKVMLDAKSKEAELLEALAAAMDKDKITTIPMTDRPPIKLKTKKGSKSGIKKGWLVKPENYAVRAYEAALKGEKEVKDEAGEAVLAVPQSGQEFALGLWEAQPKSEGSAWVEVPDAYEDEPDHS